MRTITKIACRTLGGAGIALSLYDAAKVAKFYSHTEKEHALEHHMEKTYFSSKTIDKMSYSSNAVREKAFEVRSKNPVPAVTGSVKGWFKGFAYSIMNSSPLILCSTLALLGKNILAKAGTIGIGAIAIWKVLRDGFGVGKNNPML